MKQKPKHVKRRRFPLIHIALLVFLLTSVVFGIEHLESVPISAQYPGGTPTPTVPGSTACAFNAGCNTANCPLNGEVENWNNCNPPVDCRDYGQVSSNCNFAGSGCMPLSNCTGCHPSSCTPTCGLGGCPGGCGNIDNCGGVDCAACPGGGGGGGGGGANCGDGTCNGSETCSNCVQDCGFCPSGNARARGHIISSTVTTCAQVRSSTNYLAETLTLSNAAPASQAISGGTYAQWNTLIPNAHTLTDSPPAGYVLKFACWQTDTPAAQGTGMTADVPSGGTLTWNLGYTNGATWVQTRGGDVYAANAFSSPIPPGTSPRYGLLDGTGGFPGVATYGISYDFDSSAGSAGDAYISSTGWLTNETYPASDFYAIMYHRYDSPAPNYTGDTTFTSQLASGTYYVDGNLTINTTPWSVASGTSIVVLVNGNLTINQSINLSGTGFVAFIVNGNITVSPNVGVANTSSTPALEGVYITSPTGTFTTGASTTAGSERFVGEGIFVAGDFNLTRDLDSYGVNNTTSSELFIYNPRLLITMPDEMRDLPVTWQEVAP